MTIYGTLFSYACTTTQQVYLIISKSVVWFRRYIWYWLWL